MIRDIFRDAGEVSLVAFVRLMLGGPLSLAAGFVAWIMAWWIQGARVGTDSFFIIQGAATGVAAGAVAAFFWWNTETPYRVQWYFLAAALLAAVASPYIVMQFSEIDTYNTLIGPNRRVAAIVKGDLISTMIFSSAIGANIVAAALGMYRMIRHREI